MISPEVEEEVVDPKAKKDPKAVKKDAPFTEEEEAQYGAKKIFLECKSDTEPKEVKFTLKMVYQGPDYEDPNPPEEETKAKAPPKGKGQPEEPTVRMITPEPVPLDMEQGRMFAVELGQHVSVLKEDKKEEAQQLKEEGQEIPEEFWEKKWKRCYADQRRKPKIACMSSQPESIDAGEVLSQEEHKHSSVSQLLSPRIPAPTEEMLVHVESNAGVATVEDLTFRLDPDFKAGTYMIVCKDVTPGLPPRMQMKHTRVLLKLVDLDPPPEDEQVQAKAPAKGKGKK